MREINTYLSVDLDYWGSYQILNKKNMCKYLDRIFRLECPVYIVNSHEEILQYLNKLKVKHLINIDFHADVVNNAGKFDFCDGTWANFYKYKKDCVFEWRYRSRKDFIQGRCDNIPKTKFVDIPTGYKALLSDVGLYHIDWSLIGEVCIATSPLYWNCSWDWLVEKYSIFKEYF